MFVEKLGQTHFKNWSEFSAAKNDQSIELPVYLIEKGRKLGVIISKEVVINDEPVNIYLADKGQYDKEVGFATLAPADDFL